MDNVICIIASPALLALAAISLIWLNTLLPGRPGSSRDNL